LARKTVASGVTINNVLPGPFDTDRLQQSNVAAAKMQGKPLEEIRLARMKGVPAGRFGTIEEFGALCAFVCSAQASYITGQNFLIDGGSYPGTF
jgi:3-oxoacyl-[acyl-carrier protein] reductase